MKHGRSRWIIAALFAAVFGMSSAYAGIDQASVDKCKSCHEEVVKDFLAGSHHGKAWTKGNEAKKYSCESCHGPGDKHMEDNKRESIISFGKKSAQPTAEQSKQCLSCHQKNPSLMMWDAGQHNRNDVSCASCHSAHKMESPKNPANCFSCHKDVKAQFNKNSHHPVIEGKVSCNDCHNPHGAMGHGMIKADSINQLCYKCHADKRGPFIWEHAPVEENCNNCHTSHGSQHRGLLNQRQPALCQDCHQGVHERYESKHGMSGSAPEIEGAVARGCTNCHNNIHGSNGFRSNGTGGKRFFR